MNSRLKKRGILALVIYFLMITAVSTPIAFYTGKARGASRITDNAADARPLSQSGTEAHKLDPPIAVAMGFENQGRGPATTAPNAGGSSTPRARLTPRAPSLKSAALRDAVLRTLTTGPTSSGADGDGNTPQTPLNLAMAPNAASGGGVNGGRGGTPNNAAGFPGAIIPGFTPLTTGPNTPDIPGGPDTGTPTLEDPSVIVTPIPAALPLMLTGLAGLFAMGKRTRR